MHKISTGAVQKNITAYNVLNLHSIKCCDHDNKISSFYVLNEITIRKLKFLKEKIIELLVKN
ncbi:MAG: hypothetical protein LBF97_05765 [Elusimicrobiota bacterium]|nr:hypothetical protein [Elusimicrobiota bacterium]